LVGDDPASEIYIRLKHQAALDAGIDATDLRLPAGISEEELLTRIAALNADELYLGRPALVPATPLGVMVLLREHGVELSGARAVVIGRSAIVGKPVAHLLLQEHATVTICHARTKDLASYTLDADVLVVAAGRAAMVTAEMVKPDGVVVDVGINR